VARAGSTEAVEYLFHIVSEKARFLQVLKKHRRGVISRTAFLGFLAEQSWPREVRRRISSLSSDELDLLASALDQMNVQTIEGLVTAPEAP
jgi:hypothetical protein